MSLMINDTAFSARAASAKMLAVRDSVYTTFQSGMQLTSTKVVNHGVNQSGPGWVTVRLNSFGS
jgi:hypothetical protein